MAALIATSDVNAWLDIKKATITLLEGALLDQVTSYVLGSISNRYATGGWTGPTTTPLIVKRILSMFYAGYYYLKIYSTDSEPSDYGEMLLRDAQILLDSVLNGNVLIIGDYLTPVVVVRLDSLIAPELVANEPKFSMNSEW